MPITKRKACPELSLVEPVACEPISAAVKRFVGDTPAGHLLFAHMLLLGRVLDHTHARGSIGHGELARLLVETLHTIRMECAEPEAGAAAEILWSVILEQIGPTDLTLESLKSVKTG